MNYSINHITTEQGLDDALAFSKRVFSDIPEFESRDKWLERMRQNGDLLLYAESNNEVVGIVFGYIEDNGNLTAGIVAVDIRLRNRGVGREMMLLLEERAKARGVHLIALGAVQSAEGFYRKLGYTGSLLIQSQKHSINELLSLNTMYEVRYTNIYDGKINQVCLALPVADRDLQCKYETALAGCHTQMMFWKKV